MSNNYISELEEILRKSIDMQTELINTITNLENENNFLTETIILNKNEKIISERKKLKEEMLKIQIDAENKISQADSVVKEYNLLIQEYKDKNEKLINQINEMKLIKEKMMDYIDGEAEKKVTYIKQEYKKNQEDYKIKIDKQIEENNIQYENKLKIINKRHRKYTLITIGSVVVCIMTIISKLI